MGGGLHLGAAELGSHLPREGTLAAVPLMFVLQRDGSQVLGKGSWQDTS